ncbi:hypothetical protein KCG44_09130 [Pacificimonas sp. WHA3]|uniref:Uncharacterized protein n=1 Tax=Pacificimonas pallii TaxID=2827236 RepID=A0ABS6SEW0_9SPHN|nr:hypothetical protein [Pacificimonas pallii]MBV7256943.1 hypothetical protein [Pacificimonas pallii]
MSKPVKPKSNTAGPAMTREQLDGADPKLAAAFIAFAEKLGQKARRLTDEDASTGKIAKEMREDGASFAAKVKPEKGS